MVTQAAASIPGLKVPQLLAERTSSAVKKAAANVAAQANADQVQGTPTIFVGKTGSKPIQVPLQSGSDQATLVKYINSALQ